MGGSLLLDRPEWAALAQELADFVAPGPRLNLEIGVDRGHRLLSHARRWPLERWLGLEIRRTVAEAAAEAPPNALLLRLDARTVLASGRIPPGRLSRVDLLFPTPSVDPRHLLLTPWFVEALRHALAPGGVVLTATDLPGMAEWIAQLFSGWPQVEAPPSGPHRSRRERASVRDGRPVWRVAFEVPA